MKMDANGNYYLLNEDTYSLQVFTKEWSLLNTADLSSIGELLLTNGQRIEFVPVSSTKLLVYQYYRDKVFLVDLATGNSLQPLELAGRRWNLCWPNPGLRSEGFISHSSTTAILCSGGARTQSGEGRVYGIHLIGKNDLTTQLILELVGPIGRRPWDKIVSGNDGAVYVQSPSEQGNETAIPNFPSYDPSRMAILRYMPSTQTWTTLRIKVSLLIQNPDASADLVAVDSGGRLYFYIQPGRKQEEALKIVDPTGVLLETVAGFPVYSFGGARLTPDDRLLQANGTLGNICSTRFTNTQTTTVTPTNTPTPAP